MPRFVSVGIPHGGSVLFTAHQSHAVALLVRHGLSDVVRSVTRSPLPEWPGWLAQAGILAR